MECCHSFTTVLGQPDLDTITLDTAMEEVYSAFFYTTSTYTLHQQSDKILFGHFVTILNTAFEWKLALEDEGYESSSENFNMPTPLKKNAKDPPCIQHRECFCSTLIW